MTTQTTLPSLALQLITEAERNTTLACTSARAGDVPAMAEAARRAHRAYEQAHVLLSAWLRTLPAIPTDGGELLTEGVAILRAAEDRLNDVGLHLDALAQVDEPTLEPVAAA